MACAEFRDMLGASDAFRHHCFLSQDPEALLRITRRVPQKRLQGANRTSSNNSRQNSASSQPSHPSNLATAAAAMTSLATSANTNNGMPGQYNFPPHIPQYATAPHAVRLQSDPYMHMHTSHPPGGDPLGGDSGGFTSFKYTRAGSNMNGSAPQSLHQSAQHSISSSAPPPPTVTSAMNAPPAGWASEVRVHSGGNYPGVPAPPAPGSAGWHAPWQGTMWQGAAQSHRTSSWSPRGGNGRGDQPGSLSPRSAREYIDWAPAAGTPSRQAHAGPQPSSSAPPGPPGAHGRYQPGGVSRSAFTAPGGGNTATDHQGVFLAAHRMASGDSSPRFAPHNDFLDDARSRSRSPRPALGHPHPSAPGGDPLPRHAAMHSMQGTASDAGALAALPALSMQSGRSVSPRPAWLGGEAHHSNSVASTARRSVSPRPAAHVQEVSVGKTAEISFSKGDFGNELPRGQAITL